jgi:hypothetical protein
VVSTLCRAFEESRSVFPPERIAEFVGGTLLVMPSSGPGASHFRTSALPPKHQA